MAKLSVNKETCIGCGSCEALYPKLFKMIDNKATNLAKEVKGKDEQQSQEAKKICPIGAIKVG